MQTFDIVSKNTLSYCKSIRWDYLLAWFEYQNQSGDGTAKVQHD